MTGTGTKEDPYIVSDWDEIKTAIGEAEVYVKCIPNLIIDWNDIDPTGKIYNIPFICADFDGNGLIISGIFCELDNDSSSMFDISSGPIIRNLSLINYQINSGKIFSGSGQRKIRFYNFIAVGSSTQSSAYLCGDRCYMYYSYVKHDLYANASPFVSNIYVYHTILDIYAHGDIENAAELRPVGDDFILKGKYNYTVHMDIDTTRAIIDMEKKEGSLTYFSSSGKRDLIVCNTDKIPLSDPSLAIGVTSAQLRDPAALKELGFPIMGG